MRVSDADRQRVLDELRRHSRAGRLSLEEYEQRVDAALAASTWADLDVVLRDLPFFRIADPDERPAAGGRRAARGVVVAGTAVVVAAALVIGLVAQTVWAVLLVVGWVVGVCQTRISRRSTGAGR